MKQIRKPVISVVLPCLNEERTLRVCIEKAQKGIAAAGLPGEVIVSDNGSTDNSVQLSTELGARVVRQEAKGYGNALMKGFDEAEGDYIIMADADDSYDLLDIPRFIKPLHEDGCDMVMGTRLKGKIMPGAMPWHHRWIGNPVLSAVLNVFYRTGISDAHCGMRSFTKDAYRRMHLCLPGMEFASEMVIKASKAKLKIAEIPITLYKDARDRPPHLKSFRDGWRHLRFMLMYSPTHLFLIPGLCAMLAGLAVELALFGGPVSLAGRKYDFHVALMASMITILGFQLVTMGLVAKAYSYTEKFDDFDPFITRFYNCFTLEKGLIIGCCFTLAGLIVAALVILKWIRSGFGELQAVSQLSLATTLAVIGVQAIFASFLLSMMNIRRTEPKP